MEEGLCIMIKNNIKSICCLVVVTAIFKNFIANNMEKLSMFQILLIGIIFIVIYFLFGFLFLENKGSFRKNLKSVIILCIVGMTVWSLCFYKTDYKFLSRGFGDDGFTSEWWINHDFIWTYFNVFLMPLNFLNSVFQFIIFSWNYNEETPRIMDIVSLYNIFIPSLLLCLGIELKIKLRQSS